MTRSPENKHRERGLACMALPFLGEGSTASVSNLALIFKDVN